MLAQIRTCIKCHKELDLSEFLMIQPSGRKKYYYMRSCRDCNNLYKREWASKHQRNFTLEERKSRREYGRKYIKTAKDEFFAHYGNKCVCCGEAERRFLTLDHIHNDGKEDRNGWPTNLQVFLKLRKAGWPPQTDYQTLCFNCNCGKQVNKGICPHEDKNG